MIYNTNLPIAIKTDGSVLEGILNIPENPSGIIIFAHGAGSSHLSPRNQFVAQMLQNYGFGTILFDLLTPEEDVMIENRFDIDLLTQRLLFAIEWFQLRPESKDLPIGLFGSSTGAAAALRTSIILEKDIKAVVCRGGRPDLLGDELKAVKIPVLLIVGANDTEVLALNNGAYLDLGSQTKQLVVIPQATHLFEEEGTLEQAALFSINFFNENLCPQKIPAQTE